MIKLTVSEKRLNGVLIDFEVSTKEKEESVRYNDNGLSFITRQEKVSLGDKRYKVTHEKVFCIVTKVENNNVLLLSDLLMSSKKASKLANELGANVSYVFFD